MNNVTHFFAWQFIFLVQSQLFFFSEINLVAKYIHFHTWLSWTKHGYFQLRLLNRLSQLGWEGRVSLQHWSACNDAVHSKTCWSLVQHSGRKDKIHSFFSNNNTWFCSSNRKDIIYGLSIWISWWKYCI